MAIITREEAPDDLAILFYDDEPGSFNNVRIVAICVACAVLHCCPVSCLFCRSHDLQTVTAIASSIDRHVSARQIGRDTSCAANGGGDISCGRLIN